MALSLRGVKSRYEVKEVLARGGMGVVYRAHDRIMKRPVALKALLDLTDTRAAQLFQKECEDLASLIHPNIVPIFDVGQLEDEGGCRPYLVMPLLPGATLDKLIQNSSSRLTFERCVDIFCQTCRGLQAAHEHGLIHRDLKPSNIFVMEDDSVKIIDFGVAHRVDRSQTVGRKGTLIYMSPEQILLRPLTAASDIFSLGIVCYETLTRRRPFERATEDEVADAILHHVPPAVHQLNPSVPLPLSQAIHKAMAKNALHRYRSAREFGEVLQKALRNEPIELFNPARIRPRLQRALEAYDKADYEYASEIVGELESEGHLDPAITQLREDIDRARGERRLAQLIETARIRMEEQEYQIALQKINEVLQLDPNNTDALALKAKVDARRTDLDVEGWLELARTHVANGAFGPAREALRRILELRPRDPKATQLFTEVERAEQNFVRDRETKDNLYRAAVEAEHNGDISSALSKLERVLEIDKRAPEPARTGAYQRLYDKVRSEYESIKSARAEAKRLLDDQKFTQALAICDEYLRKYPADTLFQALKYDIEEKQRQAMSARIAEIDRRVEGEPDLNRRVGILEEAVRENPGQDHFARALQNARDKRDMVDAIVARARACEEREQFNEALAQWEILQTIYPRYPGLNIEIDRLNKRREHSRRQESKARWVEQIDRELDIKDFARALELARMAQQEFPNDAELTELERLAQQGEAQRVEAQRLLETGAIACDQGRFDEGIEALRRAHDLDGSNDQARTRLFETLIEQARRRMDSDPQGAEKLLIQALEIQPNDALAEGLLRLAADRRKTQAVDSALAQARRSQAENDLRSALQAVADALATYPGEPRLLHLQSSLKKSAQEQRRRDLEYARRLAREVETAGDLPEDRRSHYETRLNRYLTEYPADEEFRSCLHDARKRLQTLVEPAPAARAAAAGQAETSALISSISPEAGTPSPDAVPLRRQPRTPAAQYARAALESVRRALTRDSKTIAFSAAAFIGLVVLGAGIADVATRRNSGSKPKTAPVAAIAPERVGITATPAEATILMDGKELGSHASTLMLAPGTHDLEVRCAGYQSSRQSIEVIKGKPLNVAVTLAPENPTLRISGSGQVSINGEPLSDISDSQYSRVLAPGDYTIRVISHPSGETSFKVHVARDGVPEVQDLTARDTSPLVVSNFGKPAKIYIAGKPVPARLAGQPVGVVSTGGLALPPLAPGVYELSLGEGKDARKRQIEVGPSRTVTALLDADPDLGGLVVSVNEDDATVDLFAEGNTSKPIATRKTKKRMAAFLNLRAGSYTVRAAKDGFQPLAPEPIQIAKGKTQTWKAALVRNPSPGMISVHTLPGAEIYLDGKQFGTASDGTIQLPNITPGNHTLQAAHLGYQPVTKEITVADRETKSVDLQLTQRMPGFVNISRKNPVDAVVTYRRLPDGASTEAATNSVRLTEGDYEFAARANGFAEEKYSVSIVAGEQIALTIDLAPVRRNARASEPAETGWGAVQWTQSPDGDWLVHMGDAFLSRQGPATIEFETPLIESAALFHNSRKLSWDVSHRDSRNFVRFDLHEKELVITQTASGNKKRSGHISFDKSAAYHVQIDWRADTIIVRINDQTATIRGEGPEFAAGTFGFVVGKNEVRMRNFHYQPLR